MLRKFERYQPLQDNFSQVTEHLSNCRKLI